MNDQLFENREELSFEAAMERLDTIVRELESRQTPLEESLLRYEEGIRLVRECTKKLDTAEQKLRVLNPAESADTL